MARNRNTSGHADHHAIVAECKGSPGMWVRVHMYRALYVAKETCSMITGTRKHEKITCYLPAGTFDARYEMHEDGWEVYAVYLGEVPCESTVSP